MSRKWLSCLFLLIPLSLFSQNIDISILRAINSPEALPADNYFKFISNSEAYISLGIPAGMTAAGLFKHDDKLTRNGCIALATQAVNFGITTALKYSINRDRPFVTYPDIVQKSAAGSPSFPSGHTSSAFALATSLSLEYPKWYIIAPSFTWASAVGYSRMYLGVHYPSDVLAGALLGSGSAWLTYEINKKLNKKSKKKSCNCPVF